MNQRVVSETLGNIADVEVGCSFFSNVGEVVSALNITLILGLTSYAQPLKVIQRTYFRVRTVLRKPDRPYQALPDGLTGQGS